MQAKSKQLVAALAAAFMAIVLIACGGGGGGGGGDTPVTAPTIGTPVESQSVPVGQTATFSVVATGSALTYQWKKNGTDISGATSSSYTTPPTSMADSGTAFSVSVSNSAGSVTSDNATLTFVSAVALVTQPTDLNVIAGQKATFSVTASGTSLGYQWKKNGVDISGATYSSHTIAATGLADAGVYSVVVSNSAGGSVTSANATLTVAAVKAVIGTQPVSLTEVYAGQPATFSVTATGTSLSYQWKKNDIDISGATSSTYTMPATRIGDNGAVFKVVVSNSIGPVSSSPATLTVYANAAPHTGVTASQCYQAGNYALVSCSSSGAQALNSQQDGNRASIGAKSYSEVPKSDGTYYDKTECVKDNITGLVWEGKTASGMRAGSGSYTNYHSSYSGTQAEMDAASNTYGYVAIVNTSGLCGFTNWRLPTAKELQTLVNYGVSGLSTTIDTTWFPNTQQGGSYYWSSLPYVGKSGFAWNVDFNLGRVSSIERSNAGHVRLVR
ncbi:MAG: DUF1566 domain-containing protein [Rhodoferax sp.]|nr:DUF1566 domain-containing protein [Rhodoferax sp.]